MFLVWSFICAVFLCLFTFFKLLCLWAPFPRLQAKLIFPWRRLNSFFHFVSALLSLVKWFVWALSRVRFVLHFWFFLCFSSDGQGWVRWYSCLLWIWLVFFFRLLFRWGVLPRVLLVVGWCWVLYSSGFLCVSSHYLILCRVSSLVVKSLGVSVPAPKAQGLISGQEWRFHKWLVIALRESKTNIQKWETTGKPLTNCSYKNQTNNNQNNGIYTYTYTPTSKLKTVQQKSSTVYWSGE